MLCIKQLSLTPVWFLSVGTTGFEIKFGFIANTSFRFGVGGMDLGKKGQWELPTLEDTDPTHKF